jgi:hypothetical protein
MGLLAMQPNKIGSLGSKSIELNIVQEEKKKKVIVP